VTEISPSYRALFRIPGIPRLIASMLLARIAGQMTSLRGDRGERGRGAARAAPAARGLIVSRDGRSD